MTKQLETIKKILHAEQITISKLADNIEINRSTLSKLINHNVQLSADNWQKMKDAYPEHIIKSKSEYHVENFNKLKTTNKLKKDIEQSLELKLVYVETECKESNKEEKATILNKKEIKTKEENRHKNLNCPESNYHMKVPYKDLLRARPLCPLTQLPMMLKQEVKRYKSMDENEKKTYIQSLSINIDLFNK